MGSDAGPPGRDCASNMTLPSWLWDGGGTSRSRNRRHSVIIELLQLSACIISFLPSGVKMKKNVYYPVSQICSENKEGYFHQNLPKEVDGVVLESKNERDLDCEMSFQTESIVEKFILKFEKLNMDCNDHLYIYDGAHATGAHRAHISCDKKPLTVGSHGFIITRTNFVTLKYKTDTWGSDYNGFTMVITAFKNSAAFSCLEGYQCGSNICISKDLVCDGISHCGHGEDESAACSGSSWIQWFGMEMGQVIGLILLFLILFVGGATAAAIWSCRKERDQRDRRTLVASSYSMSGKSRDRGEKTTALNGNHMTQLDNHVLTIVDSNGSGNMFLPVQGQGFMHWQRTLLMGA